jgi:hypothetical protein
MPEEGKDTDDINLMVENKYLKLKEHNCSSGCKYVIEQSVYFIQPEYINSCSLETCQNVSYEKVKDTDTGGKITALDDYIMCDFNNGLGFTINGKDPLKPFRPKPSAQTKITMIEQKLNNIQANKDF